MKKIIALVVVAILVLSAAWWFWGMQGVPQPPGETGAPSSGTENQAPGRSADLEVNDGLDEALRDLDALE